jgi:hypothetical protein
MRSGNPSNGKTAGESPPFLFRSWKGVSSGTRHSVSIYRPLRRAPDVPISCPDQDNDPSRQRRHRVAGWNNLGTNTAAPVLEEIATSSFFRET